MSAITIPSRTVRVVVEDATIDLVCFEVAFEALDGDIDAIRALKGFVEATLEANPGLAAKGPVLPYATTLTLPEFTVSNEMPGPARLWD